MEERIKKAASDPVYFINEFCFTFDPRTSRKDLEFRLYPFQEDTVRDIVYAIEHGEDLFIEKSRDMGVSWIVCCVLVWFWIFKKKFQSLVGSRKEDYVDNGLIDSLFGKIDYIIRHLPFRPEGFTDKNRTYMKLESPVRGSSIQGESANDNFSRAGRHNVVVFDELAFWQHQQQSWESAGDSSPCRIALTTPSPEPSYAKYLRNSGKIKVVTLHWRLHPLKDDAWYEREKLRRTNDEVARELDINWEGSLTGIVYPEIGQAELGQYPFIAQQPVYCSWDFGLDRTSIGWWQTNPSNAKPRLIHSYENSNKVLEYFLPLFGHPINSIHNYRPEDLDIINKVKDLPKATHFGDPDVSKRNLQTGTSNRQYLESAGIYVQTNAQSNDLESRKTELKLLLQKGVEVNDTIQNRFWLECLRNARYPKRDDTSQSVTPNLKPIHDWTEGHRTQSEYYAVNVKYVATEPLISKEREYDPITGRLIS